MNIPKVRLSIRVVPSDRRTVSAAFVEQGSYPLGRVRRGMEDPTLEDIY